jgi:hypothetical protein
MIQKFNKLEKPIKIKTKKSQSKKKSKRKNLEN